MNSLPPIIRRSVTGVFRRNGYIGDAHNGENVDGEGWTVTLANNARAGHNINVLQTIC